MIIRHREIGKVPGNLNLFLEDRILETWGLGEGLDFGLRASGRQWGGG